MRTVNVRLLPDKSGKVRIHWFRVEATGPIKMPSGAVMTAAGPISLGGAVGRIACMPAATTAAPQSKVDGIHLVPHSDDVRAVTCPDCLATPEAQEMLKELGELLDYASEIK